MEKNIDENFVLEISKEITENKTEELYDTDGIFSFDFENFKSNVCHDLKYLGDIGFINKTIESCEIRQFFNEGNTVECFYLLAMIDFLSNKNNIPICNDYDDIRQYKLVNTVFPSDTILLCLINKSEEPKNNIMKIAIPEFFKYNIIETEVYNAC